MTYGSTPSHDGEYDALQALEAEVQNLKGNLSQKDLAASALQAHIDDLQQRLGDSVAEVSSVTTEMVAVEDTRQHAAQVSCSILCLARTVVPSSCCAFITGMVPCLFGLLVTVKQRLALSLLVANHKIRMLLGHAGKSKQP